MASESEHAATLRRIFSTTSSSESQTEKHTPDQPSDSNRPPEIFRNIGRGTCGSVYEMSATNRCIKLGRQWPVMLKDFQRAKSAWESVNLLQPRLTQHFLELGASISVPNVPRPYHYNMNCLGALARYEKQNCSGRNNGPARSTLPTSHSRGRPGYVMERIPPIPTSARVALVKEMLDDAGQAEFLSDQENEDCLIRPYFGQSKADGASINTLRNLPLYADQMDGIGLDTKTLVIELAVGLAIIHWHALLDGKGVEFVLSASGLPQDPRKSDMDYGPDRQAPEFVTDTSRRETHLWMLDFDKAKKLAILDMRREELIQRLVKATGGNDPYFPWPYINTKLWDSFAWAYEEAGQVAIQAKIDAGWDGSDSRKDLFDLPRAFIVALKNRFFYRAAEPENEQESERAEREGDKDAHEAGPKDDEDDWVFDGRKLKAADLGRRE
ncbi:hypothetical protein QBC46DRAFT_400550 [Diplogelasinospora grovesii]|uniref:DUF3669 domain-containing protein n=1 Tax=Diplogelasinospora grovesii TaxID=303347 RepID=A0AAN6MVB2_9PEZI|nr:hypothetical protein QBC46DRAFT_400550 [Diplogelasinospora grovesii]